MSARKVFALIFFIGLTLFAEDVIISGTVMKEDSTPIVGAVVSLERFNLTSESSNEGTFTLTGAVPNNQQSSGKGQAASLIRMVQNRLEITCKKRSAIKVEFFTMNGKRIWNTNTHNEKIKHRFTLPRLVQGIYLIKLHIDRSISVFTFGNFGIHKMSSQAGSTETHATIVTHYNQAPFDDVLVVTKEGHIRYKEIVTNSDTSGIEVFMLVCADTVSDAEGNVYQAVDYGGSIWTVENLRATKYKDSTSIPHVKDKNSWSSQSEPALCFYGNTSHTDTIKKYGALYNWYVSNPDNPKRIAPDGWHVATDAEWDALSNYLSVNGYNWDGSTTGNRYGKAMSTKAYWKSFDKIGTIGNDLRSNNRSGFSSVPGGFRDENGDFQVKGEKSGFWTAKTGSSSSNWSRYLSNKEAILGRGYDSKKSGFALRLVKNK